MIEKILERLEARQAYCAIIADLDDEYYDGKATAFNEAIEIVQEVAKDGGWIPCSERLPEKSGKYLVTQERYRIDDREHVRPMAIETDYVEFSAVHKEWQRANFFNIIAWQPLPAPYQKGE